ncbi:MAG: hypothetical protein RL481_175 [Pseudomonadota bacterium]
MGFTASHLARHLRSAGWQVHGTRREGDGVNLAFDDRPRVLDAIEAATHILSSVPPEPAGSDPVIERYGDAISAASAQWVGYLSSTGVYGDSNGGWVDETAPILGRRVARNAADQSWQALDERIRVFRLPGIYGPGRSAIERVAEGKAHRIDLPGQVFSRVHVDDIVSGIVASFSGPAGLYNLADDYPCDQNAVIEAACDLLGMPCPPMQPIEQANLSPAARAFYAENRRVANGKAKRLLGWQPRFKTYREGLAACMEINRPSIASAAPLAANPDQT